MPDTGFKMMAWCFKLLDLFQRPKQRVEKFPLKEGMTVVDYGCGPGRYALPMARLVGNRGKVFAIDIQPLAINMVNKRAAKEGIVNIEPILLDSYDTGIQGASADLVLLLDTFHMISDRDALLKEIHRILKQDGLLLMDPGHMKVERAIEFVENTGLFTIKERQGKDIFAILKTKQ